MTASQADFATAAINYFTGSMLSDATRLDGKRPSDENDNVLPYPSRVLLLFLLACSASGGDVPKQPTLGHRSVPLLTVDGLTFKDLNRNGKLDPYEDWRLPAEVRAADLVQKLGLEELAGLMVHGT